MADDNLERITILLQARDKDLARSMDKMNRQIARFTRDGERNTKRMQQQVENHFAQMGQSVLSFGRNFASGLAIGAATTAIGMFTTNLRATVSGIAQVGDEARRAGLGIEQFQEWAFVAQQNRIGIDSVVDGFKELSLRADEWIVTGGGAAAEAFARLGFSAEDLRRRLEDPSELMLEIFRRMESLDRAAQIRVFDELLGGAGGERFVELLAHGEQGLRRVMERSREVGAVLDSSMVQRAAILDQKFQELTTRVERFFQAAAVGLFAGGVETPSDTLERLFGTLERAREALGSDMYSALIAQTGELGNQTEAALSRIEGALPPVIEAAGEASNMLTQLVSSLAAAGHTAASEELRMLNDELIQMLSAAADGSMSVAEFNGYLDNALIRARDLVTGLVAVDDARFTGVMGRLGALITRLAEAARAGATAAASLPGALGQTDGAPLDPSGPLLPGDANVTSSPRPRRAPRDIDFGLPGTGTSGGGGASSPEGYAAAVADIRERTEALNMEAAALVSAAESGARYGDAVEYARQRAELMLAAQRDGREITPALQAEIDALAEAYVTAGDSAEQAAERMQRVREAAEDGASFFSDFFDQFSQGGDTAASALDRLRDRLRQMALDRIFQSLAGMGGGFGNFFSMIGMGLGGKRAGGGGVMAGVPYQVNENTPNSEIFIPSRSGGVLNVAQAKDAMRGGGGAPIINIANYSGQPIEQTGQRSNGDGQREIDLAVGRSIKRGRQDGPLARYSLKPGTLRR